MNNTADHRVSVLKDFQAKEYYGVDFKTHEDILNIQDRLLMEHLNYTVSNSVFYRKLFESRGLAVSSINGVKDLGKVPLTKKIDMERHNDMFLACDPREVVDVCLTSATTGNSPNMLLQSSSDLARLAYNEEASFRMIGIGAADTLLICAALDRCFMAGLAYYLGGLKIGARLVRAGSGSAAQHWHMIKTTGATVIAGVPSLIRKIGQYALECGEKPSHSGIRLMIAIGESIRDEKLDLLPAASQIEEMWGAPMYSTYASTEMATAFSECRERKGGHVRPELVIIEIVDEGGKQVPPGTPGEVVITPIGVTGMPLIRFSTGDISFLITEPCGCGRRTPRIGPVLGRKNQMLKFKGTTVFPSSILSVVEAIDGVEGACIEARKKDDGTDNIFLYIVGTRPAYLERVIMENIRARIRVVPEIIFISEEEWKNKTYHPEKRKKQLFIDLR